MKQLAFLLIAAMAVVGLSKEKGNTPEKKNRGIKDVFPWVKK